MSEEHKSRLNDLTLKVKLTLWLRRRSVYKRSSRKARLIQPQSREQRVRESESKSECVRNWESGQSAVANALIRFTNECMCAISYICNCTYVYIQYNKIYLKLCQKIIASWKRNAQFKENKMWLHRQHFRFSCGFFLCIHFALLLLHRDFLLFVWLFIIQNVIKLPRFVHRGSLRRFSLLQQFVWLRFFFFVLFSLLVLFVNINNCVN